MPHFFISIVRNTYGYCAGQACIRVMQCKDVKSVKKAHFRCIQSKFVEFCRNDNTLCILKLRFIHTSVWILLILLTFFLKGGHIDDIIILWTWKIRLIILRCSANCCVPTPIIRWRNSRIMILPPTKSWCFQASVRWVWQAISPRRHACRRRSFRVA